MFLPFFLFFVHIFLREDGASQKSPV